MQTATKLSTIRPGMRFRSTCEETAPASPITVTEVTDSGLAYRLDEPRDMGFGRVSAGGNLYLHDGRLSGYVMEG